MSKNYALINSVTVKAVRDLYDSLDSCIEASDNESFEQRFEAEKHGRRVLERVKEELEEALSSTERMRRYNKRHPEKVSQHLKNTQDDRVERNRAHRKATDKHGEEYMKDKDVHHPDGVNGEKTKVVNQDHGRDKKKDTDTKTSKSSTVKVTKSNINKKELEDIIKQIISYIYDIGGGSNYDGN